MRRGHRVAGALAVALTLASLASPRDARAQSAASPRAAGPRTPAQRRRFERALGDAQAAYQRGDAEGAIAALERAYAIAAVPTLLFNLARAEELAGRDELAVAYYDRFLAAQPDGADADAARQAREAAHARLAPRPASPSQRASASAGARATPVVTTPHPRAAGRPLLPEHIALISTGGAVLVTGAVLGGLALGTSSAFASARDPGPRADLQDRGTALAWSADAGLVLGVGLAVLGVVLYLAQPTPPAATEATASAESGAR